MYHLVVLEKKTMFQARSQKTCTERDGHAMNHGIDKKDTLPGDSPDSHSVMKSKG